MIILPFWADNKLPSMALSSITFIKDNFCSLVMELSEVIERINAFNEQGVKLAMNSPPDYNESIKLHHTAADLAREHDVTPDYQAFSVANEIYARRRKGEEREIVLSLLENILTGMPSSMASWISGDPSRKESHAGKARLLEEAALVRRYTPSSEIATDLAHALSQLSEAVSLYQQAVENGPAEILSKEKIESRLWRTYGITAAVASELARNEPSRKKEHLQTAISYAQKELDARLTAGEREGFPLMNAYHTLGVVQTELTGEDKTKYSAAKTNLLQAKQLAIRADLGINISTLTFREAWLEYRRDKNDTSAITHLIQQVLDFQQMNTHCWDKGTKNALRQQMMELGTHLGGQYEREIRILYS